MYSNFIRLKKKTWRNSHFITDYVVHKNCVVCHDHFENINKRTSLLSLLLLSLLVCVCGRDIYSILFYLCIFSLSFYESDKIVRTTPKTNLTKNRFFFLHYYLQSIMLAWNFEAKSYVPDKRDKREKKARAQKKMIFGKTKEEEKKITSARKYTNCNLMYTFFISLRIQQTKIMLGATVRYATRITTESSHLHHKVQGFHTQNNNNSNNNHGWLVKEKKIEEKRYISNLRKRQQYTYTIHITHAGQRDTVHNSLSLCVLQTACSMDGESAKNNNRIYSLCRKMLCVYTFWNSAFIATRVANGTRRTSLNIQRNIKKYGLWRL